jgi:hypothetical protein
MSLFRRHFLKMSVERHHDMQCFFPTTKGEFRDNTIAVGMTNATWIPAGPDLRRRDCPQHSAAPLGSTENPGTLTLKLDNPPLCCDGNGLCSIGGAQLLHDVLDVHFNRLLGDKEALANVSVSIPAHDQSKDLQLASG